jgi:hypothetical protein
MQDHTLDRQRKASVLLCTAKAASGKLPCQPGQKSRDCQIEHDVRPLCNQTLAASAFQRLPLGLSGLPCATSRSRRPCGSNRDLRRESGGAVASDTSNVVRPIHAWGLARDKRESGVIISVVGTAGATPQTILAKAKCKGKNRRFAPS